MIKKYHVSRQLFDKDNTTVYNAYVTDVGYWLTSADSRSVKILCDANTQYTLSVSNALSVFRIYKSNMSSIEPTTGELVNQMSEIIRGSNISQYTFTTSDDTECIVFQGSAASVNDWFNSLMLNTGSTALPYEPYGVVPIDWFYRRYETATDAVTSLPETLYTDGQSATVAIKGNMQMSGTPSPSSPIYPSECGDLVNGNYVLPIKTGSTTTPVYLGDVQSTRNIVKTILTSSTDVDWRHSGTRNYSWYFTPSLIMAMQNTPFICSHGATVTSASDFIYGTVYCDNTINLGIFPSDLTTANDVKNWLDEQYANGTPVVIWTLRISPQTTTLNEPIRKIGNYADSISVANIPTTAGGIEFDVDTTVKPSEMDLTYHGWHEHEPLKRENGQWS